MADADLRARVVALLEQHGMTTLAGRSQLEALEAAVAVAQDGSDLPSALIHPDCQLSNAIRDPRGRISLIDWEGAGVGPRLWPLGLLLFSAVVRCVEEPCVESAPCRLDLDRVAPVLEGFVCHGTVDVRELDGLLDLVRVRPLAIAVRRFARAAAEDWCDQAWGWWSHYKDADAVAERARAELARLGGR